MTPLRIVDAVFARESHAPSRRRALAVAAGLAVPGGIVAWSLVSAPTLETWSAELATRLHADLTREHVVDLPPPKEKPAPPAPPPSEPPAHPIARARRMPSPRSAPPPPPAQAGRIIAADPSAAVDLPGTTFVTGTAATYAGGVTSSTGTSKKAVTGPVSTGPPPPPPPPRRPPPPPPVDHSSPVMIDATEWTCPWPKEADSQEINEQSVVLQVLVRTDGSAESVRTISDPGYGFGAAARACAMVTRFVPACDREGHAMRAESPPIRVHFTR